MKALFKVGTQPARVFSTCRLRKPPVINQVFKIVDKRDHGAKPMQVRLNQIKTHTGGGDIYFVELW